MYIVSACLAGVNCRYDGRSNKNEKVLNLVKEGKAIIVCPEVLGGLLTPRVPCEIVIKDGEIRVVNKDGKDCTKEFKLGAEKTLEIAKIVGADKAILKAKSPSCGKGRIYDGTFSNKLICGNGITANLLMNNGIQVNTEEDFI